MQPPLVERHRGASQRHAPKLAADAAAGLLRGAVGLDAKHWLASPAKGSFIYPVGDRGPLILVVRVYWIKKNEQLYLKGGFIRVKYDIVAVPVLCFCLGLLYASGQRSVWPRVLSILNLHPMHCRILLFRGQQQVSMCSGKVR